MQIIYADVHETAFAFRDDVQIVLNTRVSHDLQAFSDKIRFAGKGLCRTCSACRFYRYSCFHREKQNLDRGGA